MNNTCTNNYLILSSCIYVAGMHNVWIENNFFTGNSLPMNQVLKNHFGFVAGYSNPLLLKNVWVAVLANTAIPGPTEKRNYNVFPTLTSFMVFAKEVSPVIVSMANRAKIINNTFDANKNCFSGDFYFGGAITLFRTLGLQDIIITNNYFKGYSSIAPELEDLANNIFEEDLLFYGNHDSSLPLVSINFWENMKLQSGYQYINSQY